MILYDYMKLCVQRAWRGCVAGDVAGATPQHRVTCVYDTMYNTDSV